MTTAHRIKEYLGIETNQTSHLERLIAGGSTWAMIAFVAYITQWSLSEPTHLLFFASSAASAFLVFALPHGAFSQPWPVLAGQSLALLIGVVCTTWFGSSVVVAAFAVGLTVLLMHYLRCLHPPGAATAFFMVTSVTPEALLEVSAALLLNIAVIVVLGLVVNNCFHWRRYPLRPQPSNTPQAAFTTPIKVEDWEEALHQHDLFVDVSLEELHALYRSASEVAHNRQR